MDAFFVSAELLRHPALKGKLVVVGGSPERRGVVASASYEARSYGVRSGMAMGEAVRRCPELIHLEVDRAYYSALSQKAMAIFREIAAQVEVVSIDEAYLDLGGLERLWGPPLVVARHIKERVRRELSLPMTIGVGSNKLVAKVACGRAKPDGLLEVLRGQEAEFLAPFPVQVLPGIGPKTTLRLGEFGIETVGQLAQASETWLRGQFGSAMGLSLYRCARGIGSDRLEDGGLPKSMSREVTFARDISTLDELLATLEELSEELAGNLRARGLMAGVVDIKLRYPDFSTVSRQATLTVPTDAHQVIFQEAAQLLKGEWERHGSAARVRLLGVGMGKLAPLARQLPLFGEGNRYAELNRSLDEIQKRYGPKAIRRGQTLSH